MKHVKHSGILTPSPSRAHNKGTNTMDDFYKTERTFGYAAVLGPRVLIGSMVAGSYELITPKAGGLLFGAWMAAFFISVVWFAHKTSAR